MVRVATIVAFIAALSAPAPVSAHSGGLNASGCHNDRRNGGYHCHRPQGQPQRQTPSQTATFTGARRDRPFANCAEARAAGAAPVRRGQPGYAPKLDRDGDGVGCE